MRANPEPPTVAALFVAKGGCYYDLPGVDPWDVERDARRYPGPHPVVAHPPCQLWVNFAALNFKRWGCEHNRPGNASATPPAFRDMLLDLARGARVSPGRGVKE